MHLMAKIFAKFLLTAQTDVPEMADVMRSDGKIWVVIGVVALIFLSLAVYLFILDRKVKKVEDKIKEIRKS